MMKTCSLEMLKLLSAFEKTCGQCAKSHISKKENVLSGDDVNFFKTKIDRFKFSLHSYTYDELAHELQDLAFAVKFIGTQSK